MRPTEDANGSARRRPRVRWDDEQIAPRVARQSSYKLSNQPRSPLRPRPRDGWGGTTPSPSQSASTTLSMYLSDALGGVHATPLMETMPLRRRADRVVGGPSDHHLAKPNQQDDLADTPGSPLSRFLKKRNGAVMESPLRAFSATSRLRGANDEKSRGMEATGPHAGSMERLVMEKIREARLMRESRTINSEESHNQENYRPNAALVSFSTRPIQTVGALVEMSDFPTVVPTPHPKPEKPQLPRRVISVRTLPSPEVEILSAPDGTGLHFPTLETTRAARCIQIAWRRRSQRGLKEEPSALFPSAKLLPDVQSSCQETDAIHSELRAEEPNARAVMWADDECVHLEEGRVPAFELLDPAALEVDLSLEALVRTKPHVVAEIQEAERREREQTRRATRRSTTSRCHALKTTERAVSESKDSSSVSPRQTKHIRIVLHGRRRLSSNRSKKILKQSRRKGNKIRIAYRHVDTEPGGIGKEVGTETDNETAQVLLEHLSHYVVFSGQVQEREDRNDLIRVDEDLAHGMNDGNGKEGECEAISSSGDFISLSSTSSRHEDDHPGFIHAAEVEDPSSASQQSLLSEPTTSSFTATHALHADHTLALFPTLRQTELEIKRALDRIQAQYSLDQQRLIDAYADDAIFTTFFSPPPSPLDNTTHQQLSLTAITQTPASVEASEDTYDSSMTFNSAKQQEFLHALDEFRESLRASMASTPRVLSASVPAFEILDTLPVHHDQEELQDEDEETSSTKSDDTNVDIDVDAELQAMLQEIQRCKTQIALARGQRPS